MSEHARAPLPYEFMPAVPSFSVTSSDIVEGGTLPTAQLMEGWGMSGDNRSPQLSWAGFPAETAGFAVTCFDPDAPTGSGFWHWLVFNIPASVTELPAGAGSPDGGLLPPVALQARNDTGSLGYVGAAPPEGDGPHRYVFAVHALNVEHLEGVDASATPAIVGFNLRFATVARGLLTAYYER